MQRRTKNIVVAVILFMVSVLSLVVIGKATVGFTDFENPTLYRVNEENLWQSATIPNEGKIAAGENGIHVTVNDDGQIKISGTAEQDVTLTVGTIALKSGTAYLLDMGDFTGSNGSMYIEVTIGSAVYKFYNGDTQTVPALSADATATVQVYVKNETAVKNIILEPIVCVGTDADDLVSFWK